MEADFLDVDLGEDFLNTSNLAFCDAIIIMARDRNNFYRDTHLLVASVGEVLQVDLGVPHHLHEGALLI